MFLECLAMIDGHDPNFTELDRVIELHAERTWKQENPHTTQEELSHIRNAKHHLEKTKTAYLVINIFVRLGIAIIFVLMGLAFALYTMIAAHVILIFVVLGVIFGRIGGWLFLGLIGTSLMAEREKYQTNPIYHALMLCSYVLDSKEKS